MCVGRWKLFVATACFTSENNARPTRVSQGQTKGWITASIWGQWIQDVFIPFVEQKRQNPALSNMRALLVVDGHSSRKHEGARKALEDHHIDIITIPPHSSTILQPLDLEPFGIFKKLLSYDFKAIPNESEPDRRIRLLTTAV